MILDGTVAVLVKGFVSIIYLFFVIKILGKKQISELNIFDYVIGITLGNIAAEMTVNDDITVLDGLLAMSIYGVVSLFVSYITCKSIWARRFISGFPIILMENGKISKEQLKKVKLDLNDLMQDARENGYFNLSEIECAVMEVSGKVSFLPKDGNTPVQKSDMNIKGGKASLTANLVIDGVIMRDNLEAINKNEKWLMDKLKKEGYKDVSDILLVLCDNSLKLTIYPMDFKVSKSVLE